MSPKRASPFHSKLRLYTASSFSWLGRTRKIKTKRETELVSPFSYSAFGSCNSNPMRSSSSKNSAASSSKVLEDCWGKGIVSSIGRTSFCAGPRCMPFSTAITAFLWRPFFRRLRFCHNYFPIPVLRCGWNQSTHVSSISVRPLNSPPS
jgi:hypothetical protein